MRRFTHKAMDTEFAVAFGPGGDDAFVASAASACFERIDALETLFSRFRDAGEVALVKSLKPGDVASVAPETIALLLAATKVCAATGGAFDPTLGPVMDRLRAAGTVWGGVSAADREDAFARSGMRRLVIDTHNLRLSVTADALGRPTPLELDFGGIGKGFALDECRKILTGEQYGLANFLLDAGTSTVLAAGVAADGKPWSLGIGGAWKARAGLVPVSLSQGALSGSGFEARGAHVVDVRRHAAAARWAMAWARAESAAIADALSTAALSLDEAGLAAAARELDAGILVARAQAAWMDRFRKPVARFGRIW